MSITSPFRPEQSTSTARLTVGAVEQRAEALTSVSLVACAESASAEGADVEPMRSGCKNCKELERWYKVHGSSGRQWGGKMCCRRPLNDLK